MKFSCFGEPPSCRCCLLPLTAASQGSLPVAVHYLSCMQSALCCALAYSNGSDVAQQAGQMWSRHGHGVWLACRCCQAGVEVNT